MQRIKFKLEAIKILRAFCGFSFKFLECAAIYLMFAGVSGYAGVTHDPGVKVQRKLEQTLPRQTEPPTPE